MITPSFAPTSTERILPKLALDFTTANLDSRITFTRTTDATHPATYINSSGVITAATNNTPRFDYDPVTRICKGMLIEESRTNILLNSDLLSTQTVTVSAVSTTLSFYGTGNIVLSGVASATINGSGAYPTRTTYTFTPTAGSLTLTVTGTVQYAQLEAGAFVTSYIPTSGTSLTRNADVAVMTGTNFSDWFNASEGTVWAQFDSKATGQGGVFSINGGSSTHRIDYRAGGASGFVFVDGGLGPYLGTANTGVTFRVSIGIKNASFVGQRTGNNIATTNNAMPTSLTTLNLGSLDSANNFLNGHLQKFSFYIQRVINAEISAQVKI